MSSVRFAPTLVLPFIEITTPTGPATSYPWTAFDLTNPAEAAKFALFDALAAVVTQWKFEVSATLAYDNLLPAPDHYSVGVAHTGTCLLPAAAVRQGAQFVSIPGWTNPHVGDEYNENAAFSPGWTEEEVFSRPNGRLAYGGNALDTPTASTDGYTTSFKAGLAFQQGSLDDAFDMPDTIQVYSFRSRTRGYLALLFLGRLFATGGGGPDLGFICSTNTTAINLPQFSGSIGTLTINWPNPQNNTPLTLTAPLYGTPDDSAGTLSYSVDVTMSPDTCHSYDGIYNGDGTTNRCPLN